jgi:trehalose synthase
MVLPVKQLKRNLISAKDRRLLEAANIVFTIQPRSLSEYEEFAPKDTLIEICHLAARLKKRRILNINATPSGGGVAELLGYSYVPLMRGLGEEYNFSYDWMTFASPTEGKGYTPPDEFFVMTKMTHNGLQGGEWPVDESLKEIYRGVNQEMARKLNEFQGIVGPYDVIVNHDPQPAAMIEFVSGRDSQRWLWRCHIDITHPNPEAWAFIAPFVQKHDHLVFTMPQYIHSDLREMDSTLITPIVDPLHPKSQLKSPEEARRILSQFNIDAEKPVLAQVSRFDPWKDPLGVIELYRAVRREIPDLQLVYSGPLALDDPEATGILASMRERIISLESEGVRLGKDVFFLHNQLGHPFGYEETAALWSNPSTIVVQLSTREGFGMVVSEAAWCGKPVVGTRVGGIVPQIIDKKTGFLVEPRKDKIASGDWDYSEAAGKVNWLIEHPKEAVLMGQRAKEHVRQNFLITNNLLVYLQLFNQLL